MVKLKREKTPKQLAATCKEFTAAIKGKRRKEAYEFFKNNADSYKYNTEETKKAFKKMNYERCSFCTKHISDFDDEMTIEHIKTKRDYPQYIFKWSNLLCSCRTCNIKRSTSPYNKEKYLDPTKEKEIEKYFCYNLDGTVEPERDLDEASKEKAKYMIELYKLNREGLVCKRRGFFRDLSEDKDFCEILMKKNLSSQNIIFLSVFTYYRRNSEKDGK